MDEHSKSSQGTAQESRREMTQAGRSRAGHFRAIIPETKTHCVLRVTLAQEEPRFSLRQRPSLSVQTRS